MTEPHHRQNILLSERRHVLGVVNLRHELSIYILSTLEICMDVNSSKEKKILSMSDDVDDSFLIPALEGVAFKELARHSGSIPHHL